MNGWRDGMGEHDKLVEVTRNADEIQTTFIGFVMDGRVIEIGDINHKPNRDNTRRLVAAVNNHTKLVEALRDMINDPDDASVQTYARNLLAELEAGKGGE